MLLDIDYIALIDGGGISGGNNYNNNPFNAAI